MIRNLAKTPVLRASAVIVVLVAFAAVARAVTAPDPALLAASKHLGEIESLIAKKKLDEAVLASIKLFQLDASACREVRVHSIGGKTETGEDISARTLLNQIVLLDPKQTAFKSARYLVAILAHELVHCRQHEEFYALAVATDPRLKALAPQIPTLRALADLQELARRAVAPKNPQLAAYKEKTILLGIRALPQEMLAYADAVASDFQAVDRTLGELTEMEAALAAFSIPGVLVAPSGMGPFDRVSPEFASQYRFLMLATTAFLRQRKLLGGTDSSFCQLDNFAPVPLAARYEKKCEEAKEFLKEHLAAVPE